MTHIRERTLLPKREDDVQSHANAKYIGQRSQETEKGRELPNQTGSPSHEIGIKKILDENDVICWSPISRREIARDR